MPSNTDKADQLSLRQRIVNCFNGNDQVPVRAIDNLETLIESEKQRLLDELASDIAMHTVPEGKGLLSRHYVMNVIDFKRSKS